jgi:hypothetical protein
MAQPLAYQDVQPEALDTERNDLGADHNPLLSVIGAFENDPEYDALMEDVYEYRRQLDARENLTVD